MHALTISRTLTTAVLTQAAPMPQADPWTQYGPAGALLTAFAIALTAIFRWAGPLVSSWVTSRIALTDSVRKTHEETAVETRMRIEQIFETMEKIQTHIEHNDKRIDRIAHVIAGNCGRGESLDSDDEIKTPEHGT